MSATADRRRAAIAKRAGAPTAGRRFNWRLALALALSAAFWAGVGWVLSLYL